MTLEATVSIGWVNTVIGAAERLSLSANQLLAEAGIPEAACELERWPIDDITRLWHAAERCTGDPGFGLKVGAEFSPMSISGVGFALQSAATLREAIVMVQRFQRLISDGGRFQIVAGNTATWLVYHPRQGRLAFSPHQIEAVRQTDEIMRDLGEFRVRRYRANLATECRATGEHLQRKK